MNKYSLGYWKKRDGIVHFIEFDAFTYDKLKGNIHKLLENVIDDLAGYTLQKNGVTIEQKKYSDL